MPAKPPVRDAILFRYVSCKCHGERIGNIIVPSTSVPYFIGQGWRVLIDSRDVRFADLDIVRELDVKKFHEWQQAWSGKEDDGA